MEDNFDDSKYLIISAPGQPYTSKWGLEAHFTCFLPDEKEVDKEFSLLDFTDCKSNDDKEVDYRQYKRPIGGTMEIYGDASPDTFYDLYAFRFKKLNVINNTDLSKRILEWEDKVRHTINCLNPQTKPKIEFFVKVFTFIKLGYSTKYKRLSEICSLPVSLYLDFEKEYDDYISN